MFRRIVKELTSRNINDTELVLIIDNLISEKAIHKEDVYFYGRSSYYYILDLFVFFISFSIGLYFYTIEHLTLIDIALYYIAWCIISVMIIGVLTDFKDEFNFLEKFGNLYFGWIRIFLKPIPVLQKYVEFKKNQAVLEEDSKINELITKFETN